MYFDGELRVEIVTLILICRRQSMFIDYQIVLNFFARAQDFHGARAQKILRARTQRARAQSPL